MGAYGNRPPFGDEGYSAVFTTVHEDRLWFVRAAYLPISCQVQQYGAPPEVIRAHAPIARAWGRAVAEARGQQLAARPALDRDGQDRASCPAPAQPAIPKETRMLARCTLLALSSTAVATALALVTARIIMAGI